MADEAGALRRLSCMQMAVGGNEQRRERISESIESFGRLTWSWQRCDDICRHCKATGEALRGQRNEMK